MTPHCKGCTLHHSAGWPANSPYRRYNDWCCATGKAAKKAVGECKLKGLRREKAND